MERGVEQLFIMAVIILAGVFDLVVRWLKGRRGKDESIDAAPAGEPVVLPEEDADIELLTDIALPEEAAVERELPPPPPVAVPVPVRAVFRRPSPPPTITQRRAPRRLLAHPLDVRRGIVMMTILGPCRGLQPPDSEV